jgi:SAM-dependent methyltransferase
MATGDLAERIEALAAGYEDAETLRAQAAENEAEYNGWSVDYDRRNHPGMFYTPDKLAELVAQHLPTDSGPVLDIACGTGLMGERLRALGHDDVTGVDLAREMMARAEAKAVYRKLVVADLHAPLPFAPASFAAIICSSAMNEGMLGVIVLARVLPLLRPGGLMIADVETEAWESFGYRKVLETLRDEGVLSRLLVEPGDLFSPSYFAPQIPLWEDQGVYVVAELA